MTTDFETLGKAVDEAVTAVSELPDGPAREAGLELKDALEAAHKAALVAIVRKLKGDEAGKALLFELVDDPVVAMVLATLGIIRTAPPDGVNSKTGAAHDHHANDYSHGGGGVAKADSGPTLIPLSMVKVRDPAADELEREGWTRAMAIDDLPAGEATPAQVGGEEVILMWAKDKVVAYVNRCAHESMPMSDALVDSMACTVMCPWHGYRYDSTTGECLTFGGDGLTSREVRLASGGVWVRGVK